MKKFNYILGALVAGAMTFTSCDLNNSPKFNDADAFVAFTKTTISAEETAGSVEVPVLLTSLAGLEGKAVIEVDTASTAVEGVHYIIEGETSVAFTKETPTQKLKVKIIDNTEFTGDVKLVLNITSVEGVNLGKNTACTITIVDDEHPLGFLLGTYACQAPSNFGGVVEDNITIVKDDNDINTVWIGNMVPGGTSKYVYGIVNEERTEIKIPVEQVIATSSSYPSILLMGFYAPDYSTAIETGGSITAYIEQEEGQLYILIKDAYGSQVFDASGASLGWYELLVSSMWTKQ